MSIVTGGSSMTRSLPVALIRFDMAKESDVLELLRRIHLSTLTPEEKNQLRDLVFDTRFGTKAPVDEAFITTFVRFGFTIAAHDDTQVAPPVSPISEPVPSVPIEKPTLGRLGNTRLAPRFTPLVVPTPIVVPEIVTVPSATPITLEPSEVISVVDTVLTPQPTIESVEPQSAVVETVPPAPLPIDKAEAEAIEVTKESDTPLPDTSEMAERIAAIKREVNGLIGNPVNLIDVNNEVGREYMNALLDAMKKSGGGVAVQEVQRAMARLERSFVAVKETLDVHQARGATTDVVPEVPTVPEPVAVVVPGGYAAVALETPDAPTATPDVMIEDRPRSRILSVTGTDGVSQNTESEAVDGERVAIATSWQTNTETPVPPATVVVPRDSETEPSPQRTEGTGGITSVAKEKQLKELMQQRKEAEIASAAERRAASANNPLMADEVTSGLQQLLSEWKLFKSSGIFGTGPSGYEHPLYKNLSQLTMAAVLAGRFEGATPEIKRSITDYMNGWRYEEGITHVTGETFEIYLRRVIRHILDTQTKRVDGA